MPEPFRSGFVSIIGRPNVGKSTLINRIIGQKISAVTPKAQTTRHRIMGILNGEHYQIVYSDTPGILSPLYGLHKAMMRYVKVALEDADLLLLIVEWNEDVPADLPRRVTTANMPVFLVVNKWDLAKKTDIKHVEKKWRTAIPSIGLTIPVSAKTGENVPQLMDHILNVLPAHPPYFPPEENAVSNRTERFFAAEILREKIFMQYADEVPYSSAVVVTSFKDEESIVRIAAEIYVERDSQKAILIGKKGAAIKETGTMARHELETFFGKKVFLETKVKVAANWRQLDQRLRQFGYTE